MGTAVWGSEARPARVAIAMPVYDTPEHETVRCERRLIKPTPANRSGLWGSHAYFETNGVLIADARNALVSDALRWVPAPTHVLFIDADMTFPSNALARLLAHDVPIVGGLCFGRKPPFPPVVMRENHPSWHVAESLLGHVYDYPKDVLYEVAATGCGFLLVQVGVFANMYDWFEKLPNLSEDFSFCARARAHGHKIYVDTGLKIGHIGKVVIDEDFVERNRTAQPLPWRSGPK